jgi:hypothetical protein
VKSCAKTKTLRPSTAEARDHAVSQDLLVLHVEIDGAVGDEAARFDEASRIDEEIDALAGGQLAGLVLLFDARNTTPL